MKNFLKRTSILFLALVISFNFLVTQKVYADTSKDDSLFKTMICHFVLSTCNVWNESSAKAWAMAEELKNQITDVAFDVQNKTLKITSDVYDAIARVINKYKSEPKQTFVGEFISMENGVVRKTLTTAFVENANTYYPMLVIPEDLKGVPLKMSFEFYYDGKALNYASDVTFQKNENYLVAGCSRKDVKGGGHMNIWFIDDLVNPRHHGIAPTDLIQYKMKPGMDVTVVVNFNIDKDVAEEKTIELDYTGSLDNASLDVAKLKLPIGSEISMNPNAVWDNPLSVDSPAPIAENLVDVDTNPTNPTNPGTCPDLTVPKMTIDFSPLKINLKDKFPFCLPFDLVNAVKSFNTTPVAPKFTLNFPSIFYGSDASYTIDFEKFEPWAKIVRWGILLATTLGIILITKKIIS